MKSTFKKVIIYRDYLKTLNLFETSIIAILPILFHIIHYKSAESGSELSRFFPL